jgi:hypothetical protein
VGPQNHNPVNQAFTGFFIGFWFGVNLLKAVKRRLTFIFFISYQKA